MSGSAEAMRVQVLVVRQYDVVDFLDAIGRICDIKIASRLRLEAIRVTQVGVPGTAVVPADFIAPARFPAESLLDVGNSNRIAIGFDDAVWIFQQIVTVDHRRYFAEVVAQAIEQSSLLDKYREN